VAGTATTPAEIARLLAQGKIIGVARGNSEHGPRALGNRSILCDPGVTGMKDRLNHEVKFREWFRPYAPVTRLQSAGRYFEIDQPAPYMSFAPRVREEWKARLAAIVHEDGTARVQTVTVAQNPWLYELLERFEAISGYDVLMNTSFNSKGRPILTTAAEALELLSTTSLDFVVIEDRLVAKAVSLR
jgi:carbamoyltransferase